MYYILLTRLLICGFSQIQWICLLVSRCCDSYVVVVVVIVCVVVGIVVVVTHFSD